MKFIEKSKNILLGNSANRSLLTTIITNKSCSEINHPLSAPTLILLRHSSTQELIECHALNFETFQRPKAADVQQNLGKFLTSTQIKEELKEDEDIKDVESTHKDTLSEPSTTMADKRETRETNSPHRPTPAHLSPEQNHLLVSHLNNNIIKHRSANSSPARSIRSWHDSDDENFIDDDGASSISSAISLTMKTSRHNSESTLYQALLKKQQQQQHQQQHQQHMITDTSEQMPSHQRHRTEHAAQQHQHSHQQQQQQQQQEHQQHKHQQHQQQQQQYLDELQQSAVTHQQQLTANLLMARTIAFSRSRDFPELFQNPAAVAAAAAAAATASAASANAAAAAASSSNYMLPCPLCETPLEQRVFRQHLDRHYPRDSPVCPVIECGRRFAHPNSVRNHMRIKHTLQWAKMKAMRSSGGPFAVTRRSLEMRVRATDPRPCPKCGKIYRSAHTLRTHLEDKHTVCPGYRCVLCGTVAKSRNSLHSHMSRQHRGISTKDLPVLPMPSAFDPELASRLLAKAGVKISAAELRARASPTNSTGANGQKLDINMGVGMKDEMDDSDDDPEDLTTGSGFGGSTNSNDLSRYHESLLSNFGHANTTISRIRNEAAAAAAAAALGQQKDLAGGQIPTSNAAGQSLLDTYLQFITENTFGMGMSQEHAAAAALHAAKMAQLNAMGHSLDKIPPGLIPPQFDLSKLAGTAAGSAFSTAAANNSGLTIEPIMRREQASTPNNENTTSTSNNTPATHSNDLRRDPSEPMDLGLDGNNQSGSHHDQQGSDNEDNYSEDEGVHNT
ncbi:Protein abrupt [Lucilia cuprina]|nr:Protein abrupt [Lucilia cuprina]